MLRGEVWWVTFDPALGGEITKTRPAVIVSNDDANAVQNRVQVVPLTSSRGLRPWEARVTLGGRVRKAQADQIRTVSKLRLQRTLGAVSESELRHIERAVKVQLALT